GPRYSDDPVARLERQVLEVVLQLPQHALEAGFDDLDADTFVVPAHRAVHDVTRASGGVAAFGKILAKAESTGAGTAAVTQAADGADVAVGVGEVPAAARGSHRRLH